MVRINGITYQGNSVVISGNTVIIDGVTQSDKLNGVVEIRVLGDLVSLSSDASVNVTGNIKGDVRAGGSVNCDDVNGNVTAGGSVNCDDVGGNVNAGGSIRKG